MNTDEAPTTLGVHWTMRRGDTSRRRAEHRSFLQLWFTHHRLGEAGYVPIFFYQHIHLLDIQRPWSSLVRIEPSQGSSPGSNWMLKSYFTRVPVAAPFLFMIIEQDRI
jgi:hypothetical protein